MIALHECTDQALPNFAAAGEPAEACAAFVTAQRREGRRVGPAGRRLARAMHEAMDQNPTDCAGWPDLLATPPGTVAVVPGRPEAGFVTDAAVVVARGDVFGPAADGAGGGIWPSPPLRPGDMVVDLGHGLAVLQSLKTVDADGAPAGCLALEFAGNARLLVSVGRCFRCSASASRRSTR